MSKEKHYINNQDFLQALTDYKKACEEAKKKKKPKPPIPNYIGECWLKIAEGLSYKHKFINYTYKEEMIGDGIENCLMYFHNFDPEVGKNPFAYFTQIIWFAFLRRIGKEKKQMYIKYKSAQQFGIMEDDETLEMEDGTKIKFEMYDNISEFIDTYERKKAEKKVVVKKAKGIENFLEA